MLWIYLLAHYDTLGTNLCIYIYCIYSVLYCKLHTTFNYITDGRYPYLVIVSCNLLYLTAA